jgi:hypothetical protein
MVCSAQLALLCSAALSQPIAPPRFVIDLDLPPEQRFTEVLTHFRAPIEAAVLAIDAIVAPIRPWVDAMVAAQVFDDEYEREMAGMAAVSSGWSNGSVSYAQALYVTKRSNMLYELAIPFGCAGVLVQVLYQCCLLSFFYLRAADSSTCFHSRFSA